MDILMAYFFKIVFSNKRLNILGIDNFREESGLMKLTQNLKFVYFQWNKD